MDGRDFGSLACAVYASRYSAMLECLQYVRRGRHNHCSHPPWNGQPIQHRPLHLGLDLTLPLLRRFFLQKRRLRPRLLRPQSVVVMSASSSNLSRGLTKSPCRGGAMGRIGENMRCFAEALRLQATAATNVVGTKLHGRSLQPEAAAIILRGCSHRIVPMHDG